MTDDVRSKWQGLCVGGPADGQEYQAENAWMVIGQREDVDLGPDSNPPQAARVRRTLYRHIELFAEASGRMINIGFWVPDEQPDPYAFVMQALINTYKEVKDGGNAGDTGQG